LAGVIVRCACAQDLPRVAEIQAACPEAAQWAPEDYLAHEFLLACCDSAVAGFTVARRVAEGESEILNLAVAPPYRRLGIGRALLEQVRARLPGAIYLELRASNSGARRFYEALGFQEIGVRREYYHYPPETAIVMKFHSC